MGCCTVERISGNSHVSILYCMFQSHIFNWAEKSPSILLYKKTNNLERSKTSCLFLLRFCIINAGVLYVYFSSFQQIDEEEYGGTWELTKEGFMTSFALFLVGNIFNQFWTFRQVTVFLKCWWKLGMWRYVLTTMHYVLRYMVGDMIQEWYGLI